MDLYEVKARGFHSALNSREIDRLFRAGVLGVAQPCKPKGEAKWRTIDELFPVLKHKAAAGPLRFDLPGQSRKKWVLLPASALIVALLGTAAFQYWIQSAPATGRQPGEPKRLPPGEPFPPVVRFPKSSAPALDQGVVLADQR